MERCEKGLRMIAEEVAELREVAFQVCGAVSRKGLMLEIDPQAHPPRS